MIHNQTNTNNPNNTTSNLKITAQQVIDHSIRICGFSTAQITSEIVQQCKENLLFSLLELNDRGIPIWTEQPAVLGFQPGKWKYDLNETVIDVFFLNWRTTNNWITTPTGGPSTINPTALTDYTWDTFATSQDFFLLTLDNPSTIDFISFFFYGNQQASLTFQGSTDGINWVTLQEYPIQVYTDGQSLCFDLTTPFTGQYLKVLINQTLTPQPLTIACRGFYCAWTALGREIPCGKQNIQDLFAYPAKGVPGTPIVYAFRKALPPQLWFWNSVEGANVFNWYINYYEFKTISQFINLPEIIQIPAWFLNGLTFMLANKIAYELPGISAERVKMIEDKAEKVISICEANNSDDSPINLLGSAVGNYQQFGGGRGY